jgi:hypothetical protein
MTQILTGEDKTIITVLLVVYHVLANSSNGRRLTREDEEDDLNEALPLPCVCSCRQYEREGGYRIPVWWRESLGVYWVPNSWWKDQDNVNAVCLFNYKRKERQKFKKESYLYAVTAGTCACVYVHGRKGWLAFSNGLHLIITTRSICCLCSSLMPVVSLFILVFHILFKNILAILYTALEGRQSFQNWCT